MARRFETRSSKASEARIALLSLVATLAVLLRCIQLFAVHVIGQLWVTRELYPACLLFFVVCIFGGSSGLVQPSSDDVTASEVEAALPGASAQVLVQAPRKKRSRKSRGRTRHTVVVTAQEDNAAPHMDTESLYAAECIASDAEVEDIQAMTEGDQESGECLPLHGFHVVSPLEQDEAERGCCGCSQKATFGCSYCGMYSNKLLLMHRAVGQRILSQVPPGLASFDAEDGSSEGLHNELYKAMAANAGKK